MADFRRLFFKEHCALDEYNVSEWKELVEAVAKEAQPQLHVRPTIRLYGREAHQNRNVGFFRRTTPFLGPRGYRYSGQVMLAQPMTGDMHALANVLEALAGIKIDSFLINYYKDGTDCIGAHSDDEAGVHPQHGVLSVSVGATRTFRLRSKENGEKVLDVPSKHLRALHMNNLIIGETHTFGNFQAQFTHEIPVEKKVLGPRTSITCRFFDWKEHPDVTAAANAAGLERAPEPPREVRKRAREEAAAGKV